MAGRGGTSKSKGSMGKGGGVKKKKRTLLQVLNPLDKESRQRRAARKRTRVGKKAVKAGERQLAGKAAKGTGIISTKKSRAKAIGAKKGTVVQKKAVKKVSTKGGDYVKYEKKSKAAKGFRAAYSKACGGKAGPGGTFKWDGRSYSCASKAGSKKKIARGGAKASDPA